MEDVTRDGILAAQDLPLEAVEVPEWGGIVYMRVLTGKQRDEIEQLSTDRKAAKRLEVKEMVVNMVAMSLCNKDGKLLFGGGGDVQKLNEKSAAVLIRLFKVVQKISKIDDDDIGVTVTDFESGPSENSGSD